MNVTVLVGGKGTRLGQPVKCLTEVNGQPFLHWRLHQLWEDGATSFTLLVGPYAKEFAQYRLPMIEDDQTGIPGCLPHIPEDTWWALGDVYCPFPLTPRLSPAMLVTRNSPHPNIAGHLLDCGLYYGRRGYTLVETRNVPLTINTPDELEHCRANLG